ncbi:MAG: signal recognition particle-docking protein FtsY [Nitrososphaerota archaeon]
MRENNMFDGLKKSFNFLTEKILLSEISEDYAKKYLEEFKLYLIENEVAVEAADKIIEETLSTLKKIKVKRFSSKKEILENVLKEIIRSFIIKPEESKAIKKIIENNIKSGKTTIILFVGPNGGGKTLTVVKIANYLLKNGFESVIACSDTFRAGAIEQLKKLADKIKIRVIARGYGHDSASVAVDAINSAKANEIPVVLIDTAGRTEIDRNLLEEMRKIKRVTNPDLTIYVGDSLSGNVIVQQVKEFDKYVGVDGIILTKIDADVKGGAIISVGYAAGKPIMFLGNGQELDDLIEFNEENIFKKILNWM